MKNKSSTRKIGDMEVMVLEQPNATRLSRARLSARRSPGAGSASRKPRSRRSSYDPRQEHPQPADNEHHHYHRCSVGTANTEKNRRAPCGEDHTDAQWHQRGGP